MSGWDWLHAGLEVATYAQARKAQQNIAELQAEMQTAAAVAQIEAARKALVEAMRNFVFDISRDLQLAEDHIEEHPLQVYIVARAAEFRFKDSGLTPAVFPEFSDKEYVNATQKKMSNVLQTARSRLADDQIEQAELAVNCLSEMPLLHQAIQAKSSLEQIQATDAEWKSLEGSKNNSGTKRNFGILGLIAAPCLCFGASAGGSDAANAGVFFAVLIIIGAIALLAGSRVNLPKYNELKSQRENLRKNLLPPDTWHQVVDKFGDCASEQYQKLLDDRIAFLNPILGNEFQRVLTDN